MNTTKRSTWLVKIDGVSDKYVVYFTIVDDKRKLYVIPQKPVFPFDQLKANGHYAITCIQQEDGVWLWERAYEIDVNNGLIAANLI